MIENIHQWTPICVMSEEEKAIDEVLEDLTDIPNFEAMTGENDLFDVAKIKPLLFTMKNESEDTFVLQTGLNLHRNCTWDSVA